ncbi:MAG TPA: amidohydrolase, partial [Chloroflexota bacterium]|nr:amidohydrolase [Chloroflexota bacterium]
MGRAAPEADVILHNGAVVTLARGPSTPPRAQAVAVRDGRVLAVGDDREVRALAGPHTVLVDLGGRTVIPGLIDSHLHMVRAGLTWNEELRWEPIGSLGEGLGLIERAAGQRPPGTWIPVVGGWHPGQLAERRPPARAELDRAAPGHPVYVQCMYDWGLLNGAALRALGLTRETPDPPGGDFERDAAGEPTGLARGPAALGWITARIPPATYEQQIASTGALARELSRLGLTGVIDGGGLGTRPETYRPLFELWRRGGLTIRTRLTVHPGTAGEEREEVGRLVRYLSPRFGDGLLQVLGAGEILVFAIHDLEGLWPMEVTAASAAELRRICSILAEGRWPLHLHATRNEVISAVLDAWEAVDREFPIGPLRWAVLHAELIDEANLRRVQALGAGLLVQSRYRLRGDELREAWGAEALRGLPPLRAILDSGVAVGGGTDAMRVAAYHPFRSLHWFVTGRTPTGVETRSPEHCLSREEALRLYTLGSAWFSFEEGTRGSLEPGKLADLAVLSADFLTVP